MVLVSVKQLTCFCALSKSYLLYHTIWKIFNFFQQKCLFLISGSQSPLSLWVKVIHPEILNSLLSQEEFLKIEVIAYFESKFLMKDWEKENFEIETWYIANVTKYPMSTEFYLTFTLYLILYLILLCI